jgi:hypothetical protein
VSLSDDELEYASAGRVSSSSGRPPARRARNSTSGGGRKVSYSSHAVPYQQPCLYEVSAWSGYRSMWASQSLDVWHYSSVRLHTKKSSLATIMVLLHKQL